MIAFSDDPIPADPGEHVVRSEFLGWPDSSASGPWSWRCSCGARGEVEHVLRADAEAEGLAHAPDARLERFPA